MIYLLLTALFVAALAFQAWLHSRERERMLEAQERLMDRVQAPEKATLYEPTQMLPAVPYDDDEAFHLATRDFNGD